MASTPILTSKARSAIDKENILVHSTTKPNVTQGNPIPPAKRLRRNEFVECKSSMRSSILIGVTFITYSFIYEVVLTLFLFVVSKLNLKFRHHQVLFLQAQYLKVLIL